MALIIRQMEINDIDAADEIARLAFNSPQSRVEELSRFLSFQPDGWLVAVLNGELAGMVGAVDYGLFASIGMMVVHPDLQRKGIGLELMGAILDWIEQRGCPQAILEATPSGEPLYTRLGFIPVDITLRYKNSKGAGAAVLGDRVAVLKAKWSSALAEFDGRIFGADRGRILQRYFNDFPERSFFTFDQYGEISGYMVCRDDQIGPWVAVNEDTARRLLVEASKLKFNEPPTVLMPALNHMGIKILEEYGFGITRSSTHMVRGEKFSPINREYIFGETSLALG